MATHWNSQPLHPGPPVDQMSLKGLLRRAADEASEIIRSEANVIKLEIEESTRALITDALKAAAYSAVALLGLLSLLAFVIIGLADIITNAASPMISVWASALIIGVLLTGIGGVMAVRYAKRIGQDAQMKKTRSEFSADKTFIKDEWRKI
ncbi:phage holin family protein [Acidiferrobacter thiooxydans]